MGFPRQDEQEGAEERGGTEAFGPGRGGEGTDGKLGHEVGTVWWHSGECMQRKALTRQAKKFRLRLTRVFLFKLASILEYSSSRMLASQKFLYLNERRCCGQTPCTSTTHNPSAVGQERWPAPTLGKPLALSHLYHTRTVPSGVEAHLQASRLDAWSEASLKDHFHGAQPSQIRLNVAVCVAMSTSFSTCSVKAHEQEFRGNERGSRHGRSETGTEGAEGRGRREEK